MHISDGILSSSVLLGGVALTTTGVYLGLKRIDTNRIMEISLIVSAFFVASLIHIPVGFTNVHLTLNGLTGLLLGEAIFPAIFAGLTLQLIFFQFGGLLSIGVNTFNMAAPGLIVYYMLGKKIRKKNNRTAGFMVGAIK